MCAENIFVDELSIEPCHKTMTMTFQKGLNYLKGQNGFGKNHAVRLCGRDQK